MGTRSPISTLTSVRLRRTMRYTSNRAALAVLDERRGVMTEWVIDTTGVTADSVVNVAVGTLGNSSYVYPVLPGLTLDVVRSPEYNTGITQALSGKESRIAYRQY